MATLNMIATTAGITMSTATDVDHAAKVSGSASGWAWTTTGGYTISAASPLGDIAGGATPTAGTIFSLVARNGTDYLYDVSGLVASLVAMTAPPNLEGYWRAILAGDTTILPSLDIFFSGAGDFLTVAAGESLTGGNDSYVAQFGTNTFQQFQGDALGVAASGTLRGGADSFLIRDEGVFSGDASDNAGTLVGGNDTFVTDMVSGGTTLIGGDVITSTGDTTGGDDVFTVRPGATINFLAGDAIGVSAGILRGGADRITLQGSTAVGGLSGDVDTISGGTLLAGADAIFGNDNGNTIHGDFRSQTGGAVTTDANHTGNDFIDGGGGGDTLFGQVGDDTLRGGPDGDTLDGGAGNDAADYLDKTTAVAVTLNGSVNATVFVNGVAEDLVRDIEAVLGGSAGDSLTGDGFANFLVGNDGADILDGGSSDDTLVGGAGIDNLTGGAGKDFLVGGLGSDILTGGPDKDTFLFDTVRRPANIDTLVDFSREDVMHLDKDVFRKIKRGILDKDAFVKGKNLDHGRDEEDRVILKKSSGELLYDKDGSGDANAKVFAILTGSLHGITNKDFLISG